MKLFCPLPRRFAVVQMDPTGMVRHFDDPIASAAAQAMRPKKYLVYLQLLLDIPTPTKPWFRFEVCPIGTTLRPEDEEHGITSDMVIPIFPNTSHPRGRKPIQTESTFPFPNCYHWINNRLVVRVRRKAVRYDDSAAVKIGVMQSLNMEAGFTEDYRRLAAFEREKVTIAAHSCPSETRDGANGERSSYHLDVDTANDPESDVDSLPEGSGGFETNDVSPSTIPTSIHNPSASEESFAAVLKMNLFGADWDDTIELLPLVDLWFELGDHLTANTIPSPVELYKEWETIMQIIHDARDRAPSIRLQPSTEDGISIDYDALSSLHEINSEEYYQNEMGFVAQECPTPVTASPVSLNKSRLSRKISVIYIRARRTFIRHIFTLPSSPWRVGIPCLPFWP
ncbi:hypothetical protein C8Q78DRAFT_1193021 [Trametes maxima]|nr:hypothetical protein C8Q78DRAFT_1193021 [Trametes maxima]